MSAVVPPAMRARLEEYGTLHQTRGNELCHFVGVPMITLGAATLFEAVRLFTVAGFRVTLADAVIVPVIVFYLSQARLLGLVTALVVSALVLVGQRVPFWVGFAVFFVGWAIQFYGHSKYEKRSPAFLQNLVHLLVGPAWLVERALFSRT